MVFLHPVLMLSCICSEQGNDYELVIVATIYGISDVELLNLDSSAEYDYPTNVQLKSDSIPSLLNLILFLKDIQKGAGDLKILKIRQIYWME